MLNACKLLNVSNVFMLEEHDHRYTTNLQEMFDLNIWNETRVKQEIERIVKLHNYDVIYLMLPDPSLQHAHHQLSCIWSLQVFKQMFADSKSSVPLILMGGESVYENYTSAPYDPQLTQCIVYNEQSQDNVKQQSLLLWCTVLEKSKALVFRLDRQKHCRCGHNNELDAYTILSWLCAEHKSQGKLYKEIIAEQFEQVWLLEQFYIPEQHQQLAIELFSKLQS